MHIPNIHIYNTSHFVNINIVFTRIIMRKNHLKKKHRKIMLVVFVIQVKIKNINISNPGMEMATFGRKRCSGCIILKRNILEVMKLQESIPLPLL